MEESGVLKKSFVLPATCEWVMVTLEAKGVQRMPVSGPRPEAIVCSASSSANYCWGKRYDSGMEFAMFMYVLVDTLKLEMCWSSREVRESSS